MGGKRSGVFCEIVFPSIFRSYAHKASATLLKRLLKHELNKDKIKEHAKLDEQNLMRSQLHTWIYKQPREDENGTEDPIQGTHTNWFFSSKLLDPQTYI